MLLIPLTSSSQSALVLDLGVVQIDNKFVFARTLVGDGQDDEGFTSSQGHPAIVDQMEVSASSVHLGRASDISRGYRKDLEQSRILKTRDFGGKMNRNLSSWCEKIPHVDVTTSLESIKVRACLLLLLLCCCCWFFFFVFFLLLLLLLLILED